MVAEYCAGHALKVDASNPGPEGYILRAGPEIVVVAGSDDRGAFYGLQSLRQLAAESSGAGALRRLARFATGPQNRSAASSCTCRGADNIPFFKRFVRDTLALYKYNTLIVEMNASMRLERHPELNSGWVRFSREINYWRHNYPPGAPHEIDINSSHQDTADGGFLEKEEVADLARYVRQFHMEFVPELPSFTHSYYLLSAHPELSEVPGELWPDTYCPSNPESYKLLFDVYDEYIELLKPRMVHAGHDELFQPVGLCPRCRDKDIRERYGEDVRKIHDYLAGKGVRMAIWGDMLLEGVRGVGLQKKKAPDGFGLRRSRRHDARTGGAADPERHPDLQLVLVGGGAGVERETGRRLRGATRSDGVRGDLRQLHAGHAELRRARSAAIRFWAARPRRGLRPTKRASARTCWPTCWAAPRACGAARRSMGGSSPA